MEKQNVFKYSVPFTMVANELIMCENMSPILKTVYSIACCYASSLDSSCFPSYTTIARKAGIGRSTAIRSIKKLVAAGLMAKEIRKTKNDTFSSNTYIINQWNAEAEEYFNKNCKKVSESNLQSEEELKMETAEDVSATENIESNCTINDSVTETPGSVTGIPPHGVTGIPGGVTGIPGGVTGIPPILMNNNQYNNNYLFNNNQSINQRVKTKNKKQNSKNDGLMDEKEKEELNEILGKCCLKNFTDEIALMFQSAIERLFYSDKVKVGEAVLPNEKIRSYLQLVDEDILDDVVALVKKNDRKIKNPTSWLMSTIINEICFSKADFLLTLPAMYQHNSDYYAD